MQISSLAIMARLVLCVLALLAAGGLAEPVKKVLPQKIAETALLQRQLDLSLLFYHIHEPVFIQEQQKILESWDIEKNIEHFSNVTAVKILGELLDKALLPRGVPFSILNPAHLFEVVTVFNVLYSAKDYDTFYKTAVVLRQHVNEGIFVYVLSAAILHRLDTQGVVVPPIYEILPYLFNNGEIMSTAQRINVQGKLLVEQYPSTFVWNDNVVIRWNETVWPYVNEESALAYFTHDHTLNTFYYNQHLIYPFWLGGENVPLKKDRRGEWLWFVHKQIMGLYYMTRLSEGLGEIPELGLESVDQGYCPGLIHHNGIPFPVRPDHYNLLQPHLVDELTMIDDYERRVREAIDRGYVETLNGEHINILTPEAIDILGNVIEANVDSPNNRLYRDFISLWKIVLGNSMATHRHAELHNNLVPLVLPSTLEQFQTSLRDPAFYMIWKRVLGLFVYWQKQLPLYKPEELALPQVKIQKVEVDKLVTYFEYSYMNITNCLHMSEHERHGVIDEVSVLVQRPQLNHKVFQVRINVKSEVAKTVVVRLFLAPKYDGYGSEIPLLQNSENMVLLDQFTHDLPVGDSVIKRDSTENVFLIEDWPSHHKLFNEVEMALHGKGQIILDQSHKFNGLPQRLLIPKGDVGGMPFILVVYISEYHAPRIPYGTGFDPAISLGIGTGANRMTSDPLGYPFNRPVHNWQVSDLPNFWMQDVTIYHKPTPEIDVPQTE